MARIVHTHFKPDEAVAVADLTPAYGSDVSTVRRTIALLDDRQYVVVEDEVQARRPVELWWFMHTTAAVDLDEHKTSATLKKDGRRLLARIVSPVSAEFQVMAARPLSGSPRPARQNGNVGFNKLAIQLTGVTETHLVVELIPLDDG